MWFPQNETAYAESPTSAWHLNKQGDMFKGWWCTIRF